MMLLAWALNYFTPFFVLGDQLFYCSEVAYLLHPSNQAGLELRALLTCINYATSPARFTINGFVVRDKIKYYQRTLLLVTCCSRYLLWGLLGGACIPRTKSVRSGLSVSPQRPGMSTGIKCRLSNITVKPINFIICGKFIKLKQSRDQGVATRHGRASGSTSCTRR